VALSIRTDLPYKNFEDIRKANQDLIVGTTGPGSNAHDFPLLLKEFAGAKFKLVSGYPSNGDVMLALQRKEADVWAALATTIKLAVDQGVVRAIVRGRVATPGSRICRWTKIWQPAHSVKRSWESRQPRWP